MRLRRGPIRPRCLLLRSLLCRGRRSGGPRRGRGGRRSMRRRIFHPRPAGELFFVVQFFVLFFVRFFARFLILFFLFFFFVFLSVSPRQVFFFLRVHRSGLTLHSYNPSFFSGCSTLTLVVVSAVNKIKSKQLRTEHVFFFTPDVAVRSSVLRWLFRSRPEIRRTRSAWGSTRSPWGSSVGRIPSETLLEASATVRESVCQGLLRVNSGMKREWFSLFHCCSTSF